MTRKLFYEDPNLAVFTAKVVSCEAENDRWAVILDATAFYPEGGGQAADVGFLGDVRVLDTRERGDDVVHFCDGPLAVGSEVTGEIDWLHRFDLMQQHTGEHILSGILNARFGYQNVGFHVGADVMEVDFDGPLTPEEVAWAELEANKAIWQNLPVRCWYPAEEELPYVIYRTKRALPWPVRIVQIPGVDSCACCGIHVSHTGQVGLIKVISCVKFHQGVRLEMVCGQRAYAYMCRIFEQNKAVSQMLSAQMPETASAALFLYLQETFLNSTAPDVILSVPYVREDLVSSVASMREAQASAFVTVTIRFASFTSSISICDI
jgi:alanyl-tRNA synthetase